MYKKGNVLPTWQIEELENVSWCLQPFNDNSQYNTWLDKGYKQSKSIGAWIDITSKEFPKSIKDKFENWQNLNDIGLTIYKMLTSEILPVHFDLYSYYKKIFKLDSSKVDICRTIVMLENWSSGHYLEIDNEPIVNWKAGDWYMWENDTLHMAANIGVNPRYTLQITGWKQKI